MIGSWHLRVVFSALLRHRRSEQLARDESKQAMTTVNFRLDFLA
jgi:hypothetical protein